MKPTFRDISIPRILSIVESCSSNFDQKEKNLIRAKCTNIITNFVNKQTQHNRDFDHLTSLRFHTHKFLKEHPEIIVTKSDKGGVTVVMNKQDYIDLSYNQLSDERYYKMIPRDPTNTIEQKINKTISSLKNNHFIDERVAKSLMSYDSVCPKFYGLPKIHKPELALRPIISSINSPSTRLSKFLKDIPHNAYNIENNYYVKDSFHFANFINDFQLPQN